MSTTSDFTLPSQAKKSNTGLVIGLTIGGIILIIIIAVVLYFLLRKKKCTSSSDCSSTEICSNGTCIPNPNPTPTPTPTPTTCTSNGDCAPGSTCQSGRCVPGAQCTNNSDCPTGQVCVSGGCVPPAPQCQKDADCSAGTFCCAGTCQTCCTTANCPPNNTCINHTCVPNPQCSTTADCAKNGEGGVCNNGQCTCTTNSDCANIGVTGGTCKSGKCVVGCVDNAGCPPNTVCSTGGTCVPVTPSQPCSPSNPGGTCPNPGDQCVGGTCLTPCTSGSTCPTGMRCVLVQQGSCAAGCSGEGTPCGSGGTCSGGNCIIPNAPVCTPSSACPAGTSCVNIGPPTAGFCEPGCQQNSDCGPGKVCSGGNCVTSTMPTGAYTIQYQASTSTPNYLTAYYDPTSNNAYMSLTQTKDSFGNSLWQYTSDSGFLMTNLGVFGTDTSNPPIPLAVSSTGDPSASGWSLSNDQSGQIEYSQGAYPCLNYTNNKFVMGQCAIPAATGWTFTPA